MKKEREQARDKLEDALAEADTARHELAEMRATLDCRETTNKRRVAELEANLAEAMRKKNRERCARDDEVKKKVTMCIQRDIERALKVLLEKCDYSFKASGVTFDAEASSSEEEGVASAGIAQTAATPAEKASELPMVTAPEHGAGPEPTLPVATAATTVSDSSSTSSSESAPH